MLPTMVKIMARTSETISEPLPAIRVAVGMVPLHSMRNPNSDRHGSPEMVTVVLMG